jgi:hypothetical protein
MLVRHPRMRLGNYIDKSKLPTPPASVDYSAKAMPSLRAILRNQEIGDCVCAWICHATGIFTGNADNLSIASDADATKIYEQIGGFNPADPANTDNGCDENTALAYWQSSGITIGGTLHKIDGSLNVDANDPVEQRIAIWLFENLMYGVGLPDAWCNNPPTADGWTWDLAGPANNANGHCFGACGFSGNTYKISTWGMLGNITDAATAAYAASSAGGQLFVVWTQESISRATGRAPSGLDWNQLLSDAAALG